MLGCRELRKSKNNKASLLTEGIINIPSVEVNRTLIVVEP